MSLIIRNAEAADAAAIQAIYAPIVLATTISFEDTPPSVGEMTERITTAQESHAWLVAERAGLVIGYAYAGPHRARPAYRWSTDVTAYVAASARREGVGRQLYEALLPQLAERGCHAAFAGIALPNDASVALHEAVGFRPLGIYREVGFKFGRWHDVGWWQRLL